MSKRSSQNQKPAWWASKQFIGIVIGVVIVIAAIAYFVWPSIAPVTELRIEDMVVGTGAEAKKGDTVTIEYTGWLSTKSKSDPVDSSYEHSEPFRFVLGQGTVIQGWEKGILGMKVGGKRKLTIPPDLGYGATGAGNGAVPPNAVLVFELELVDVQDPSLVTPLPTSSSATTVFPTVVTATGLKIEDLVIGDGREVKKGDNITVAYTGWLEDGTKFDSSSNHETPFQFILGKGDVIEGWDQGLLGMKVGGKRKLTIPPDLGYGAAGAVGGRIPPNATLIFEVEILAALGPPPATLAPTSITELKIEDLVVGDGPEAKAGDTIRVHYTGWLEDDTKFDSSLDRGEPIEFVLGKGTVIAGWDQGLLGMKVGGKRRLTIPPDLAYGASGAGDIIPANAALIFEVELLEIK